MCYYDIGDSMKKNGYTVIDIIVLVLGLALVFAICLPKFSHAFETNTEEIYQSNIELYLQQAALYGNSIKEEVKNNDSYIITIKDLVDNGYLGSNNGEVVDVRDNSSMLEVKIHLIYDEENDNVYAEMV